jgi:hypothetical protein
MKLNEKSMGMVSLARPAVTNSDDLKNGKIEYSKYCFLDDLEYAQYARWQI